MPSGVSYAIPTSSTNVLNAFSRPEISNDGQVAFAGFVSGPGVTSANNTAIWAGLPGQMALVARAGDPCSRDPQRRELWDLFNPVANPAFNPARHRSQC